MNRLVILAFLLLSLLYAHWQIQNPPLPPLEPGFQLLFDGETLDGWYPIGGESTFRASRREIIGTHGPGENTFLRTRKTYRDFILKLDFRWDELGNSGVLFRAAQRDGDGRAYGYQFELDHSDRAWSGGLYDEARRGWLYDLADDDAARAAIRRDDWNEIIIEARGTSIKTFLNGVPLADVLDGLDAEGYIALQVHSGDQGVMRWRNIRIRELDPVGQPGEGLADSEDWQVSNVVQWQAGAGRLSGQHGVGVARLTAKRPLRDFMAVLQLPVCDDPSRIRVRQRSEGSTGKDFAELVIDSSSATLRTVVDGVATVADRVDVDGSKSVSLRLLAVGERLTVSIDERDVARLTESGLPERGKLVIEPGRCGESFVIDEFQWWDLRVRSKETLFYQTLDNAPAPIFSPEQALADFRLAPEFEIELVAAEPLVEDPVAMAWDEYGRLYVVEMRGFMPDAYGNEREAPVGRVVRLTDDNGDGRMDRSEVFLDALVNPRAVAVVNEGILIGEPPNLWLCELADHNSGCVNKRSLGEYGVAEEGASVEHLENRLLPGLDNWLYNSKSTRKLRLSDGQLEQHESLFRGQWGITRDNAGRLLYNHNSNFITADFFAAEDLFDQPSFTGAAGLGEVLTTPEEVFSVRVNPGVNRAYLEGTLRPDGRLFEATAVSGLTSYRGDQFPAHYLGHVFVPEAGANVVAQFAVTADDLVLAAEHKLYEDKQWGQREFLGATDERFRPVDAMNGPDGALYIIDMYRGIVQDEHFLTEELREQILLRGLDRPIGGGRIWRVRHRDGKADRSFPLLADASATERVAALGHTNGWVRDTAQRLLLTQRGAATDELHALLAGPDSQAAIHALWTLHGREELRREGLLQMLAVADSERQVQALRAGRGIFTAEDLLALDTALTHSSAAVRMQLAFALGDAIARDDVQLALLQLLNFDAADPYVQQAVVRSVRGVELEFLPRLLVAPLLDEPSEANSALLMSFASAAYRSLRGPLDSKEPAPASLLQLLSLIEQQRGARDWVQEALLEGLSRVAVATGFTPAVLEEAPPIFSDGTVDEDNPLWAARLQARRAFTWPGDELAAGITPLSPSQLALLEKGAVLYSTCATCHGAEGGGTAGLAPTLVNSEWVNGPPEWLARIILQGYDSEREAIMPPHGHLPELDDPGLAGLMLYLRRNWGHTAAPVAVEVVTAIRQASSARKLPWTALELEAVPVDRGYQRFAGVYQVSFITFTITEEQGKLFIKVPMYGSGELAHEAGNFFVTETGGETVRMEFQVEEDGSVQQFILFRDGQEIPVKRKP